MNEPKKKKITFEDFKKTFAQKPPTQPKLSDWGTAYQNVYGEGSTGGTTADSLKLGLKLTPYQEQQNIRAQSKEQRDISEYNVDYKKKLLDLQEKQKEAQTEKVDDITKERSKIFTELSKTEGIISKTKKVTETDEEGEYEVEKPAYSPQQRKQAKRAMDSYTKRLQVIDMVEKFREKGVQVNVADVEKYLKEQEKNIDAITLEMTKKGIPDRVSMVFKNTALQIMMEGNSKQTAMQKAAEQVKTLFPQYFQ